MCRYWPGKFWWTNRRFIALQHSAGGQPGEQEVSQGRGLARLAELPQDQLAGSLGAAVSSSACLSVIRTWSASSGSSAKVARQGAPFWCGSEMPLAKNEPW